MIVNCKVKSIEPLASNTCQIVLQPIQSVDFKAGQYLMVVMGEKDKRPFSIASSPCRHQGELELHIGSADENPYSQEVVEKMRKVMQQDSTIEIDAPHGDAWLQESNRPLLLIAGGTGFSYVRSMLDHCLSQNINRDIYLYWGARTDCQLYAYKELMEIAAQHSNITFVPVVEQVGRNWQGKTGNVLSAIKHDFDSLEDYDIYIAGRFEMAGAAREQFTKEKNALVERMFSDAYSFI